MSALVVVICLVAALLQFAVLRDKTIIESKLQDTCRIIRTGAYVVLALSMGWSTAAALWVHGPMALALSALAVADGASAAMRLFPEHNPTVKG
jgi:hypothetical protein